MDITKALFEKQDPGYRDFNAKLIPNVPYDKYIGVRLPDIKAMSKTMTEEEKAGFLSELPHKYHDENILHAFIISGIKDPDRCLCEVERFLPYIDNWAVNDTILPKALMKKKDVFVEKIKTWVCSDKTYTVRFGVLMLMKFFLGDEFDIGYNDLVATVVSDEYYVNMMCAWYFATALAKQYEQTIPYLENKRLSPAVYKMTVRKACESYRVSDERKKYIKSL